MSLSIILEVLEKSNKVIWMTRIIPDQRKISDILGHLKDSVLNRMIVIEFGDNLSQKLEEITGMLSTLEKNDLLIINDWCENYGRAKSKDINLMKELVESFDGFKIIITSDSYEDASGENRGFRGFMFRGGKIIESSFRTVWVVKIDNQYQKILISDGEKELVAEATRNGYKLIN
jgi:hypothetical protein|tara:strand:- start:541 stop:1065 length:525 start_codon:yes stop_codon:yes gene_type:complete